MDSLQRKTSQRVYSIVKYSTPAFLLTAIVVLLVASVIVRDTTFPNQHPIKFTLETLMMGLFCTIPFMYLFWSRTGNVGLRHFIELVILVIKFAGFHVLFQFSGVYSMLFV